MTDPSATSHTPAATSGGTDVPPTNGVVFLGDSLTEGGDWSSWFPNVETSNAGVGGETTSDVLDRLDAVVAAHPEIVVLMIGTNDLAKRATVEQVVRGVENILVALHRDLPTTRLIVQSVLPRDRERSELVRQINIHLRQFAPAVRAEFLDLWPAFAQDDGELNPEYSDDRLHLNAAGYAAWVDQLRPLLGTD